MGFIKTHIACDECGSSDAAAMNADGSVYCFSCSTFTPPDEETIVTTVVIEQRKQSMNVPSTSYIGAINDRRIAMSSAEKYGVTQDDKGNYYFPYRDEDGNVVAYKQRSPEKDFTTHGTWKEAEPLFGMSLFNKKSAKSITCVEGEGDCLAVYQMLGSKWPVVSLKNGAGSAAKDFKAAYDYLDSFETIVVCFDNDAPGKEAVKKVCEIFGSKIKVMKLDEGFKDACDYLRDRKESQFVSRYWQAEQYVPDGLVNGSALWEEIKKPRQEPDAAWPYNKLNEMLCGLRKRELITVAAGTGSGKSTFLRQLVHHLLTTTNDNIGLAFLEESPSRTALGVMSVDAMKPLHLPTVGYTEEELRTAFNNTMGTGRVTLLNHFGSLNIDNVLAKLRWMAKGQGCQWIFLDHYQMILSGIDMDERKGLDMLLTKLRQFVEESGVGLFGVSHTRRDTSSKGAENGAELTLSSLRGTAGIGQLSDAVIGLQRDQQHDDERVRNTTQVRLLKSRFTGETGPAGFLYFSKDMNRLVEVDDMPLCDDDDEDVL